MKKPSLTAIVKEQFLDQLLHFFGGMLAVFLLGKALTLLPAIAITAMAWIAWENSQFPNHNSKGYDDASIDRFFQEAGIIVGALVFLSYG